MEKCRLSDQCPFFSDQLPRKHTAKEREDLKRKFCGLGNSGCARFIVANVLGLDNVPENLYPDDHLRANALLDMP
jgi:hypothetical protein